jgi:hypothetical protein
MKKHQQATLRIRYLAMIAVLAMVGCSGDEGSTGSKSPTGQAEAEPVVVVKLDAPLAEAVGEVLAHTPKSYPDDLAVVQESDDYAAMSTPALMELLGNWNPAVRRHVAGSLAQRGDEVVPALTDALGSEEANRRAGAATALAGLVTHRLRNWQEVHPEIADQAEAHAKIRGDLADLLDVFIKLTKDADRDVRDAAMGALGTMAPDSPKAARAVLAMCSDPDVYLAAAAFIRFEKQFDPKVVERDELLGAIRTTLAGPFPRSKGHAFRLINKMDDDFQRELIPQYIEHLDWQPMRDTMFGAGGQADAVRLCAKFKVRELLPRLTMLMDKTMRGPGLFEPCVEAIRAFGKDAKPILPELKQYIENMEATRMAANPRHKDGIQKKINQLKEAVDYVENL